MTVLIHWLSSAAARAHALPGTGAGPGPALLLPFVPFEQCFELGNILPGLGKEQRLRHRVVILADRLYRSIPSGIRC